MLTVYLAIAIPVAVVLAVVVSVLPSGARPPKSARAPTRLAPTVRARVAGARTRGGPQDREADRDAGGHRGLVTLPPGDRDQRPADLPSRDPVRTPDADSATQRAELALVRERISALAAQPGSAVRAGASWVVDGSAERGTAMLEGLSQVMRRAYDAEAATLVRSVRTPRTDTSLERLEATRASLERLTAALSLRIADDYHRLRVLEQQIMGDYVAARRREQGTGHVHVPSPRATPSRVRPGSPRPDPTGRARSPRTD